MRLRTLCGILLPLLMHFLETAVYAATADIQVGAIKQIHLPDGYRICRTPNADGEIINAFRSSTLPYRLEIEPIKTNIDWSDFAKGRNRSLSIGDLEPFSHSGNALLIDWSRSKNVEYRVFDGHPMLWRTSAGGVSAMKAWHGKRVCFDFITYNILVLVPPVNGVCCQLTFGVSEEGLKNAGNEQAKKAKLDLLEGELASILKSAVWR